MKAATIDASSGRSQWRKQPCSGRRVKNGCGEEKREERIQQARQIRNIRRRILTETINGGVLEWMMKEKKKMNSEAQRYRKTRRRIVTKTSLEENKSDEGTVAVSDHTRSRWMGSVRRQ